VIAFAAAFFVVLAQALPSVRVEPIRIAYHVLPQCPDETQFLGEVSSRTALARKAADGDAAREFVIDITEGPNGSLSGTLEIHSADGAVNRRAIAGGRCAEVVSALALMVALAVDPDGALRSASSPPTSPPDAGTSSSDAGAPVAVPAPTSNAPPAVPAATGEAGEPAAAQGAAAPVPSSSPASAGAAPTGAVQAAPPAAGHVDARTRRRLGHWAIGVQGQVLVRVIPSPALGAGATLDYVSDRERISAAELRFTLSAATTAPTFTEGVGAQLLWAWARGEGCPFGFRVASALRLAPCLGLDAGLLHVKGTGLLTPASDTRAWFAGEVLARLSWTSAAGWLVEAGLGAQVPFEQDALRYSVGGVTRTAYQLPVVALDTELGLAHSLP
jgi:hypothetical protein